MNLFALNVILNYIVIHTFILNETKVVGVLDGDSRKINKLLNIFQILA